MTKKYYIITYGCQMNKSDSERIAAVLESTGYKPASKIDEADLVVVNMCSVRQSAVDRVYGLLNQKSKIKNQNDKSKSKIILTGCVLETDKKKLKNKVDLILNIKDLPKWPATLQTHGLVHGSSDRSYFETKPKPFNKFSGLVPIMTGCNNFCAFCVVPYTRGREVSRPADEIICEVKNLVKQGCKEIWLLGQNVNSYRCKDQRSKIKMKNQNSKLINFPKLLKKINKIPGKFWIKFTSSHPKDFSDELIDVMAKGGKITEYLNLPVQAGDNKILKKMNRPYTIAQYKNLVKKIRKKIPEIALSTDVIVGFPGETKKQFENTVKLFKEIKFDMAYIAKYSERTGTAAAKLKDNVPQKEKERREKVLTEVLRQTALKNNKKYIGKAVEVLITGNDIGKTRTNKTVKFQVSGSKLHDFAKVKIIDALPWGLKGEIK